MEEHHCNIAFSRSWDRPLQKKRRIPGWGPQRILELYSFIQLKTEQSNVILANCTKCRNSLTTNQNMTKTGIMSPLEHG